MKKLIDFVPLFFAACGIALAPLRGTSEEVDWITIDVPTYTPFQESCSADIFLLTRVKTWDFSEPFFLNTKIVGGLFLFLK